jgi:hypothetical protein
VEFIGHLWLPIVVATVIAFVASSLLWMAGPHHKKEWKPAPDQNGLRDVLRKAGAQPGAYMFPFGDRSNKEAFAESMKQWAEGPAGILYIYPKGPMAMGGLMVKQAIFFLVVNVFLAYLGTHAGLDHTSYLHVFRVVGTGAFMAYFLGAVPESIWFGRPWKSLWLTGVDALIYALLTAGTFGWLWPR